MYKNKVHFHTAITYRELKKAKKFYSEVLRYRLDNLNQDSTDVNFLRNELTLHASELKLDSEKHDVGMENVLVSNFVVHLSSEDFDDLKKKLNEKGTKYKQGTFFIKDPNDNLLQIKTLNPNF